MSNAPRVSYIVLSYNYENYIAQAIQSILDQTHQDFEIVVIDDASSDRSCEVIQAFGDSRIRLIRNETNIGGAASYNRAVEAARGEWLANLDADDWIDRRKTERQLDAVSEIPDVAVVGSFVHFVGGDGQPLVDQLAFENEVNVGRDLNLLTNWIGRNSLCRSSTMVRRDAHLKIGLDDPTMSRAPDYDLWCRFVRERYRFLLIPERLVYYRIHTRNVTYGDPIETFREMCWAMLCNIRPAMEDVAAWSTFESLLRWIVTNPRFADLGSRERERLLALYVVDVHLSDYASFSALLNHENNALELTGRRVLGLILGGPNDAYISKLTRDIAQYLEAIAYWKQRSESFEFRGWRRVGHRASVSRRDRGASVFRKISSRSRRELMAIWRTLRAARFWGKADGGR